MDGTNLIMEPEITRTRKGITGSTLKLIAIITMLIDHFAATIIEKTLAARGAFSLDPTDLEAVQNFYLENGALYGVYSIMRLIGRIAFPIFCFLLVEGFQHTRNKNKYAFRLALFALISEIPFDLALFGTVLEFSHQNVFFTLLIGLLVMFGFQIISDKVRDKKWLPILAVAGAVAVGCAFTYLLYGITQVISTIMTQIRGETSAEASNYLAFIIIAIVLIGVSLVIYLVMIKKSSLQVASVRFADLAVLIAGMMLADALRTDYSAFGVLTIAVTYALRRSSFKAVLGGCITLTIMSLSEITAFVALIPAYLYNGQRGLKLKIVFYAFYPVHLLILYLVCYYMKLV